MPLPPQYRPQIGVNVSELHRKVAQEMYDAGERAWKAKVEAASRHDYAPRDEWYVIARRVRHGLYNVETIEPVLTLGVLKAQGPTAEWATRQLSWVFACTLHRMKFGFDPEKGDWPQQKNAHWTACRERAHNATFKLVETLGER